MKDSVEHILKRGRKPDGKKKRLDASLHQFFIPIPGAVSTLLGTPIIYPVDESITTSVREPYMTLWRAWVEYTGVPAMIGGGLGALGINIGLQGAQVRSGTSLFAASRFGFGLALLLEASIGTAIFATVMTILDPDDLHAGGLTNEPIGKTLYDHSPAKVIIESESVPQTWKHIWLSPSWA